MFQLKFYFHLFFLFLIFSDLFGNENPSCIDLSTPSTFVLETKQIVIPDYPMAFNPSITIWKNKLLLSFRIRETNPLRNYIGFVWMDKNFNVKSKPYILDIPQDVSEGLFLEQDARLIVVKNKLFVVYNNFIRNQTPPRMHVAEVHFNGKKFYTETSERLVSFESKNERIIEKNWTPFVFKDKLLLAYTINPHTIFSMTGKGRCSTMSETEAKIEWNWGELRGGTPALKNNDEYLGFFHSSIKMRSIQSNGEEILHYFMGAYTFSQQPPFSITRMSSQPILTSTFYNGPPYFLNFPSKVIFPAGFVMNKQHIWVVYGRQDCEVWVMKIDKKGLLESLTPVN